jgi:predicted Zn-ribbon and HTH transcriptional regulator
MEARLTLPRALRAALETPSAKDLHELSAELHVSEKLLPGVLEKLSRTLRHSGQKLTQQAACCLECGFGFDDRTRFTTPSRCPRCRSERIAAARFRIE